MFALCSAACGSGITGTWETTAAPAGTTSYSDYKQTLVIQGDNTFNTNTTATFTTTSSNPGCITTVAYDGTWNEPAVGQIRFVNVTKKNSTRTACSDGTQNYAEADAPASGAAAVAQVFNYKLTASTLTLSLENGQAYATFNRK
jgi:hypothetical protein